jgi:ATP-dependent exoDNAse (exonuclease V) alpha subunit
LINTTVIDEEPEDFHEYIHLVPTNYMAKEINQRRIDNLDAELVNYKGSLIGEFSEKDIPTDIELFLKVGARVMLLNNDKKRKWTNGEIVTIHETKLASIVVQFADKRLIEVFPHTWESVRFIYDENERKIVPIKAGSFIQIPVKLAWAITIHKA